MTNYYLNENQQPNGDNEVHAAGCSYMPKNYVLPLGSFTHCAPAVVRAKQLRPNYRRINGCYWCCRDCHTS